MSSLTNWKIKLLIMLALIGFGGVGVGRSVFAQGGLRPGQPVTMVGSAPGACTTNVSLPVVYNGILYQCVGGTYSSVSTTAAGGSITGLTATRVPVAASATTLTDYSTLSYDGTGLGVGGVANGTLGPLVVYGTSSPSPGQTSYGNLVLIGSSTARLFVNSNVNSPFGFHIHTSNTAYPIVLQTQSSGGTVGIGETTPLAILQVTNVKDVALPNLILKEKASQSADALQVQDSSGNVLAAISRAGEMALGTTILANTFLKVQSSVAGSPAAYIRSSANTASNTFGLLIDGGTNASDYVLRLRNSSAGATLLTVTGSGLVQIGSSSTGIAENAAGVLEINSGTAGTYRDLKLRSLETTSVVGVGSPSVSTTALNVNKGFADVVSPSLLNLTGLLESTSGGTITNGYGLISTPIFESYTGGTWTNVYGLYDGLQLRPIAAASTTVVAANVFAAYLRPVIYSSGSNLGTYTNTYGSYIAAIDNQATGGTFVFTNVYGQYIANQGTPTNQAGATVTNAYGLYLANQTGAGTLNYAIYSAGGASLLNAGTSTVVPLTLKGAASQSGDLTQWQNSSGTVLFRVTAAGDPQLGAWMMGSNANNLVYGDASHAYLQAPTSGDILLRSGAGTTAVTIGNDLSTTLAGNLIVGPSTIESFTTNASALGTLNYYTDSQTIYYDTAAATADVTINVDASASVDLNTRLATGQMVTVVLAVTNTGTAYKCNTLQVHSVGQTIRWVGGSAPTGNINAVDWYTFTIMKTGASTYYVTGSQTSYK